MPDTAGALVDALDASFQQLRATYADLDADALHTADVVGYWTPKDVVAHLVYWTDYATRRAAGRVSGVPYEGEDLGYQLVNDREYLRFRDWSAEHAVAALDAAHAALVATVSQEREPSMDNVAGTIRHYNQHAEQLRAWRESR